MFNSTCRAPSKNERSAKQLQGEARNPRCSIVLVELQVKTREVQNSYKEKQNPRHSIVFAKPLVERSAKIMEKKPLLV